MAQLYCRVCGKFYDHKVSHDCRPTKVDNGIDNAKPKMLSTVDNVSKPIDNETKAKVLSTVLSTKKRMTDYERLKKWRASHREEYNEWMREYRKRG